MLIYEKMQYLDIHTHSDKENPEVVNVQSLTITDNLFLPIPKSKPISVGLHPWFSKVADLDINLQNLKLVAAQENVKLIGECGLDRLRGEKMADQIEMLTRQIIFAEQIGKPLILHCVRAFSELIALKDKLKVKVPMLIHGFNKNEELGMQLLAKGFILSFGAGLLKPKSGAALLIRKTDRFFLETDDGDTTIEEIYAQAAILKNCSLDALKARIFNDWKKIINNNV